jgi:CheY-like chemotaxis protein
MAPDEIPFHILYIEDDEVDIQSVEREIKKLQAPVSLHIARNGIEALDMLYGRNGQDKIYLPHIILLDINMPKMNGIEFLQKLRADPDLKKITVYILTTAYTTHDKIATQGLHVAGYIVKPLQHDDLMHVYYSLLG